MNGVIQYIVYLITGFWFFMTIVPVITYGAGVRIWGLPLVLFPFLLAGYVSGLSFLFPRAAAIIGTIIGSSYLLAGISEFYRQQPAFTSQPLNLIVPAVILLMVSIFALREDEEALWRRSRTPGRIVLGIFAGAPALFATLGLLSIARLLLYGLVGG
jgi:hypothetical protein